MPSILNRLFRRNASARPDETKTSRTGPLMALYQTGRPVWTPRDYAGFAREGFKANAIVYRAVRMVSEAAASVPLLVFEGRHEQPDHPLARLLSRPNPRESGAGLLEALFGHLLISGNGYLEAVGNGRGIAELYALRPDRMRVVPSAEGWPAAYDYTVSGQTVRFDQTAELPPVLHMTLFNPTDDHYGLSPMEAAAAAIDIHNAAAGWNKALLDNAARPSGALVYAGPPGATLGAEQFERLKSELEASFQGSANAGRPLLLEGGLDWKPLSLTPKDMDFMEAKSAAAREIALAFGVPPMLLGLPGDNTFANYAEANRSFWRQTVIPLVNRTAQSLGHWLGPAYGNGLRLEPDLDQINALAPEREALWARVGGASFLTDDEKREAVGYGPKLERKAFEAGGDDGRTVGDLTGTPTPFGGGLGGGNWANQPRVPAGDPGGGQWTNGGGGGIGGVADRLSGLSADKPIVTAVIWDDLEALGGGPPRPEKSPKGAPQWKFPNGGIIRFDLLPHQLIGNQVPHINLQFFPGMGKQNIHINLK